MAPKMESNNPSGSEKSKNLPLWKKIGTGVAAAAALNLVAACTSDAEPIEPNRPATVAPIPETPTPSETEEAPKTQAEVNQEVLESYTVYRELLLGDTQNHLRSMLDRHGSKPQEITDTIDYLEEARNSTEQDDPRFFSQLGHNVMVYMNLVMANSEYVAESYEGQFLRQAGAVDIIQNIEIVQNDPNSDKIIDIHEDEFIQTVDNYVSILPDGAVVSDVSLYIARNDPTDFEEINNGTWFDIEITEVDGTIVKDHIQLSTSTPDATGSLNYPFTSFNSVDEYNGVPFQIGFHHKVAPPLEIYSIYNREVK